MINDPIILDYEEKINRIYSLYEQKRIKIFDKSLFIKNLDKMNADEKIREIKKLMKDFNKETYQTIYQMIEINYLFHQKYSKSIVSLPSSQYFRSKENLLKQNFHLLTLFEQIEGKRKETIHQIEFPHIFDLTLLISKST